MYKIIIYKFQEHFIRFYMGWDLIHQFNNTELCACPKLGPGFPISYVEVLSMLSWDPWSYVKTMSADGDNLACRLHGLTRHISERGSLMTISQFLSEFLRIFYS